jgi:PAS domain S-box-containing protein
MKLATRINLFSLIIPALMAVIIVISGLSVMNRIIYDLNYKLILKEMNIITSSIKSDHEILKRAGVDNYPHYIKLAKTDFLKSVSENRFQLEGELFILDTVTDSVVNKSGIGHTSHPDLTRDIFPYTSGELRINDDGKSFYLNYVKIPYWNWIVIIIISGEDLYRDIYNYLMLVIPISLIPLIIGFFLSYFSLKNVLVRIHDSLVCLNQVESGNLNINIKIKPVEDEIQLIQKAINQMIGSLKESYNELEQRVEKRTEQLATSNRKLLDEISAGETARSEISYLNQYLKNIIDSMPSILIGINRDLTINKWNSEAERVSLLLEKDVMNSSFTLVFDGEKNVLYKMMDQISNGDTFTSHQTKIHLGRSQHFYADISYFPLKENRNEMGILQIRDITERFQLEELIKQSEKMLSVGSLAAGMAHEINNPLAGMMQNAQNINRRLSKKIRGNIEAAEECGTTIEDIEKYSLKRNIPEMVQSILDSGKKAAEIVDDMISFSKNDKATIKAHQITEILDRALLTLKNEMFFKEIFDNNKINVITRFEDNLPEIFCEESKIQDVFSNILKNAIQAMIDSNTKNPTLNIFVRKLNNEIRIKIEDNGPGIDNEIKKRVFEPFFSTKAVDKGKGLGLSTSYFIIREHHKGNLWLETEIGKGTSFFIALPIRERREVR